MMRDSKGKFAKKNDEGLKLELTIPSIKKIIFWILLLWILMPWISIIAKFQILKKIFNIFEDLLIQQPEEATDTPKKNGLFY